MVEPRTCMTTEHLEDYLHGSLSVGPADAVERHLADCALCVRQLQMLESRDSFYRALLADNRPQVETDLSDAHVQKLERALVDLAPIATASDTPPDPNATTRPPNPRAAAAHPFATASDAKPSSGESRFRILRPHAKGGLGVVYVAHDEELGREVALKEIQLSHAHDHDSKARFVLEAEITGGLEHPGIVPVYGMGRYGDGRPYYAMRFIRGDSFKEAVDRFHAAESLQRDATQRNLGLRQLLRRFFDVCNAIEYAHSKGVLHRDLKPGNIMLGKFGETIVIDWGLAKATGKADPNSAQTLAEGPLIPTSGSASAPTQMGSAIGTPAFMSPEQAAGRLDLLGPASDVYSLGATLYYALTGQAPITSTDAVDILNRVQKGDFPRPRQLNPTIHPALEAICLMAMARDPDDRYASAGDLKADVERWLDDSPVSAWPEPLPVKIRRWVNRHRTMTAGTAATLLAAVVFLIIFLVILAAIILNFAKLADGERVAAINAEKRRIEADKSAAEWTWMRAEVDVGPAPPGMLVVSRTGSGKGGVIFRANLDGGGFSNMSYSSVGNSFPTWSPDGELIAFDSSRERPGGLFIFKADGTNLGKNEKYDNTPSWPGVRQVYLMAADKTSVRRLTNEKFDSTTPSWSRDGKTIAFQRNTKEGPKIFIMKADGSDAKEVGDGYDPALSPDGNRILFGKFDRAKGYRMCVMDVAGGNVKVLSPNDNRFGYVYPAWSPNGKRIAWTDEFEKKLQLFVADADGKNARQLTNEGAYNTHASWSPDSKQIAFIRSDNGKTGRHYVIDADGQNLRLLLGIEALLDGGRVSWWPK
jgi:serine/threonine protein kinase/Tol biopolymer transport system component